MAIIVIGEEKMADVTIIDEAFAQPSVNAEFHWYLNTEPEVYMPYLVKAMGRTGTVLSFRGVDLQDPTFDFGPSLTNSEENYSVDLGEIKYVYRQLPSTLNGLQLGSGNCYALLFLSERYRHDSDPQSRLTAAEGGPKWPKGLERIILALQIKLAQSNARYAKAFEELKAMLTQADSAYTDKINEWFKQFTP